MPPDFLLPLPPGEADLSDLEKLLQPGEYVVACFVADLDLRLKYSREVVVLSNRRVLAPIRGGDGCEPRPEPPVVSRWQSWSFDVIDDLRVRDRAGLGKLELIALGGEVCSWRYTVVAAAAAHDLVRRFRDLRNGLDPADEESDEDDREPHFLDREPSECAAEGLGRSSGWRDLPVPARV